MKILHRIGHPISKRRLLISTAGLAMIVLAACQLTYLSPTIEPEPVASSALDTELTTIIETWGLTGDPSVGRNIPSIDDPLAQLGKKLFFTKALGGDQDSACASCHLPTLGGGDALSLSIGTGADDPDLLGPGRTHPSGGPTVPRNAPTTFNVAMWDSVLFHDGRIESLGKTPKASGADGMGIRTPDTEFGVVDPTAGSDLVAAQSRFPVTSPEEMRGFAFEIDNGTQSARYHLAARLGNYGDGAGELEQNNWPAEFETVFGSAPTVQELITEQRIATALAAYERSQTFVDTPWRAYVQGDTNAIDASAKRGALLFYNSVDAGGAGCTSCHIGDFFTDEAFHNLAIPQLGPGKADGSLQDHDFGRFRETGNEDDLFAFRTPSLLNVEVTGPYGHDGAYTTLEGIVRHHLNPTQALEVYDFAQLDPTVQTENCIANTFEALEKLEADQKAGRSQLQPVQLTDAEIGDLVSFLHALTDPCVKDAACLDPWMPSPDEVDPDGLRLMAVTQ